ncbi:hypothetical protein ACOCGX_001652 [Vibrio cholerae]
MKRKAPNAEPPRALTEAEKENLRKDMQESSKWAREELRKRKEAKLSSPKQLDQDGPRSLTPEEIEDLRLEKNEVSAKMTEFLEKTGRTKLS